MIKSRPFDRVVCLILILFSSQSCSIHRVAKKYAKSASNALAEGLKRQPDPIIARESASTLLLSIDAAVLHSDDDPFLLLSGAQAYVSYCSAFIHDESAERAFVLYEHALHYAFSASRFFLHEDKTFAEMSDDQLNSILLHLDDSTVPFVYWTATAWAGWLITHPDTILAMADLPKIIGMMEAVLKIAPEYNDGGVYLFLAIYESRKPVIAGGDLEKCRIYFEKAEELAGKDSLMPLVLFAQYYARAIFDRELFESTLQRVLSAPSSKTQELNLSNALAKQKATKLLSNVDVLF